MTSAIVNDSHGAVASGHPLTSKAAVEMLRRGGNAFDSVVAAAFASTVTEPCLTSLGGGGFLLAHQAKKNRSVLYDFFVDSPGKGIAFLPNPELEPVDVHFVSSSQVFHVGAASVAVPGMLKGLVTCFDELCTLDIEDILAPAITYLQDGVEINSLQEYLIRILMPILARSDYGREIYHGKDKSGTYHNPLLLEFLKQGSPDRWVDIFYGSGTDELQGQLSASCGLVTSRDLKEYEVIHREPLSMMYRGFELLTNPPPSSGGSLLFKAFSQMSRKPPVSEPSPGGTLMLAEMMDMMNRHRKGTTGTTHISVIDRDGNAASLTASNGSNSGIFAGRTGIMLNNMMGEDDLHPEGFHAVPSGQRIGSMMSPMIIRKDGEIFAVLGSGGSKRIRTAMLQVIHNLLDRDMPVGEAIESPRLHLDDDGMLQVEPGFPEDVMEALLEHYPLNIWTAKDLYFGGVHTVTGALGGCGDSRRGGAYMRA